MSMKPEPVDFDQKSQSPLIVPTHLVVNATVSDDISVMQTAAHDVTDRHQTFNNPNHPVTLGEHSRSLHSVTKGVRRHGKFDTLRVHTSARTVHPSFTIDREEIELNSKLLPKKYMCGFCVYKTSYKSDLNRHLRRHNQRSNFHCQLCNMPFRTEGLVYHHIRTAHGQHMQMPSAKKYACDVCSKSFVSHTLAVQHKAAAHGIITYSSQPNGGSARHQDSDILSPVSSEIRLRPLSYENLTVDDDSVKSSYCPERDTSNGMSCHKSEDFNSSSSSISPAAQGLPSESTSRDVSVRTRFGENGSQRSSMAEASLVPSTANPNSSNLNTGIALDEMGRIGSTTEATKSEESSGSVLYNKTKITADSASSINPSADQQDELVNVTFSPETGHYSCELCGLIFKTVNGILKHKSSCRSGGFGFVKTCSLCPFQSSNIHDVAVHSEKHSSASFCCELCNRPFVALQNLLKHKRFFHGCVSEGKDGCSTSVEILSGLSHVQSGFLSHRRADFSSPAQRNRNDSVPNHNTMKYSSKRPAVANSVHHSYDSGFYPAFLPSASNPGNTVVTSQPPESGRYAKLVSDFDDFATRPYACALCFFRTHDVTELSQHAKNHLTGCNTIPIPETARFVTNLNHGNRLVKTPTPSYDSNMFTVAKHEIHEQVTPDGEFSDGINGTDIEHSETNGSIMYRVSKPNGSKFVRRRNALRTFTRGGNNLRRYSFLYRSGLPGRRFPCASCNKSFSMRILLTRHVKNVHGVTMLEDDIKQQNL